MDIENGAYFRLQKLRRELKDFFKQREEVIDGALVALLANAHLLLLGPPGTAKSLLASTLCAQLDGARFFYFWLNKFITWRELACGQVIVREETNGAGKSIHFINTEGQLLHAHIAVLDEIFKASSATANSLLSLLNERRYSINPGEMKTAPLLTVFAASNEMPGKDQDELRAFSDRFLLRYEVDYISISQEGESAFLDMLAGSAVPPTTTITLEGLYYLRSQADLVQFDRGLLGMISAIRAMLKLQHQIEPSDRRYREALRAIKAYAFLNGHARVELEDLVILEHILWTTRERSEREAVRKVVHEVAGDPRLSQVVQLFVEAQQLHREALRFLDDAARMVPFDEAQRRAHAQLLADAYQREQRLTEIYQRIDTLIESATGAESLTTMRTFLNEVNVLRKSLVEKRGVENPFIEVNGWTQSASA